MPAAPLGADEPAEWRGHATRWKLPPMGGSACVDAGLRCAAAGAVQLLFESRRGVCVRRCTRGGCAAEGRVATTPGGLTRSSPTLGGGGAQAATA